MDSNRNWNGYNAVYLYRSSNLATWEWRAAVLSPGVNGAPDNSHYCGRPTILYNSNSGKYVCLFEDDGGICAAYSTNIEGPYTWVGRIPNNSGYTPTEINDASAFQVGADAYIVGNNEKGSSTRKAGIWKLRASDYLAIESRVIEETFNSKEAHHILKIGNTLYWFASGMDGWNSTATYYRTSSSLASGWNSWSTVAINPNSGNTYNSQHDFILPVVGSETTSYIYCGDRWSQYTGTGVGHYIWLPLTFNGSEPAINWYSSWNIDAATGQWQATSSNLVTNPGFESDGTATRSPMGWSK